MWFAMLNNQLTERNVLLNNMLRTMSCSYKLFNSSVINFGFRLHFMTVGDSESKNFIMMLSVLMIGVYRLRSDTILFVRLDFKAEKCNLSLDSI